MITLLAAISIISAPPVAAAKIVVTRVQSFDQIKTISVAGAPSGSLFAVGQENGQVRLMNAAARQTVFQLVGHPQPCYGLAFSPNGQQLVTGDETARIFVWDVKTGRKLREFPRGIQSHQRGIQSISFSKDGKTLVTTGKDDVIIFWDYATATPKLRVAGNGVVFTNANLTPNGMVVGTLTEGVHFRKAISFALDAKKNGHGGLGINEVAINPTGTRFVTAGRDNVMGVWDTASKSKIASLKGHDDWVQHCAISSNGKIAASSANDRKVIVWDLTTFKPIATLPDQCAVGAPLAFTGDGKFLLSGTINDGLQINSVTPPQGAPATPPKPVRRRK